MRVSIGTIGVWVVGIVGIVVVNTIVNTIAVGGVWISSGVELGVSFGITLSKMMRVSIGTIGVWVVGIVGIVVVNTIVNTISVGGVWISSGVELGVRVSFGITLSKMMRESIGTIGVWVGINSGRVNKWCCVVSYIWKVAFFGILLSLQDMVISLSSCNRYGVTSNSL